MGPSAEPLRPRAQHAKDVAGCDVAGTKVLMVCAGGIGCELVKNLVLCGFRDIEAVRRAARPSASATWGVT